MKVKMDGKDVTVTDANGVSGCLIKGMGKEPYTFRVYDKDGGFIDYDIEHFDLDITINLNAGAAFYTDGDKTWLDHDPDTLGYKVEE